MAQVAVVNAGSSTICFIMRAQQYRDCEEEIDARATLDYPTERLDNIVSCAPMPVMSLLWGR
jgi:hypothetical protein